MFEFMKKSLLLSLVAIILMSMQLIRLKSPSDEIALNAAIPKADLNMKDVKGNMVNLNSIKTDKGILVIFSCNTCPYVKLSESRIKEFTDYCLSNGIGCILVNSNEAQRTEEDSFDEMVKYHKEQGLKCSYVVDTNSQLADAFGATRTPQCFLFNKTGLIYKGAIDDNVKDAAQAKSHYLKDALEALVKGSVPSVQQTKSIGCTIKRNE